VIATSPAYHDHPLQRLLQNFPHTTCPSCSLPASRLAAAPMLGVLSPNKRILHERNERSAHEPKVVRREDLPRDHRHHEHDYDLSPLIKQQFADIRRSAPDRPSMVGH
jgi:hypothetical protein